MLDPFLLAELACLLDREALFCNLLLWVHTAHMQVAPMQKSIIKDEKIQVTKASPSRIGMSL